MRRPRWSLVQYCLNDNNEVRAAIESGGDAFRLPLEVPAVDLMALLKDWDTWSPVLHELDVTTLEPLGDVRIVAPLTFPNKLICAGANYYDHAEEMGTKRPNPSAEPFFFLKPPTTTIIGPGAPVPMPLQQDANVDWEAELGVVISHSGKNLDAAEAGAHIAGYVVANDVSARGLFVRPKAVFPAFGWDWFGHKSQDGFCPIGPGIVPEWMVPDPQALRISLSVNGVMKQDSNTNQMVVGVRELVAAASQHLTLEPGDVILTGTPAGVGMPKQDFLRDGDLMVVEIDGVGRLENRVVG